MLALCRREGNRRAAQRLRQRRMETVSNLQAEIDRLEQASFTLCSSSRLCHHPLFQSYGADVMQYSSTIQWLESVLHPLLDYSQVCSYRGKLQAVKPLMM